MICERNKNEKNLSHHSYIAEYKTDAEKKKSSDAARDAYKQAMEIAESGLLVTHPIRLGLALNFSVFYYEVLNLPEEACQVDQLRGLGSLQDC